MAFPGTNLYADADGDEVSNFDELEQNSNPFDDTSTDPQAYVIRFEATKQGWSNSGMSDIGIKGEVKVYFTGLQADTDVTVWIREGRTQEEFIVEWVGATPKGETWNGAQEVFTSATLPANSSPYLLIKDAGLHSNFTNTPGGEYRIGIIKVDIDVEIAWPWQSTINLIAANSICEIQDEEKRALINVTTDPPGLESFVTLSVEDFQPATGGCTDGTLRQGTLVQNSDTQWVYTAYSEPLANLHPPEIAEVTIGARISGTLGICSEVQVRVYSAFEYIRLYAARKHLDGDAGASYVRAYNFIRCKYTFLNGVGDGFDSVVFLSQSGFPNPDNPTQTVSAYTESTLFTFYDEVTFGTSTWDQENVAASIVGHELVHTGGLGINAPGECEAYQWEIDSANVTGINCGAGSYRVGEAQNLLQEYNCE